MNESLLWYQCDTDRFLEYQTTSEGQWMAAPYTICFALSRHCNFECSLCISDSSPRNKIDVDWIEKSLTNINNFIGNIRVVWSGGEPTLHPNLREYVNLSKLMGNANILATNGSKFMEALQVDWVDISIYAATQHDFTLYTNSRSFAKLINNLALYSNSYPRVVANFIVGAYPIDKLKCMIDLIMNSGISNLKFHRIGFTGRIKSDFIPRQYDEEVEKIKEFLIGKNVCASFSQSQSSDHKLTGYWVARSPGVLTNGEQIVALEDSLKLRETLNRYNYINRTLFV